MNDIILADDVFSLSSYKVGEVVAVAQAYRDCENNQEVRFDDEFGTKGWNNKMFVCADLMPYQIRFTDLKLEKLQDISDDDCLREGVLKCKIQPFDTIEIKYQVPKTTIYKNTPREAFAALIDKISGRGTWESNPYVFTYSFELVQKGGRK